MGQVWCRCRGKTTLYKVIDAVASGRHTFGSAVTRRQTANRPQGMFTPSTRPGRVSAVHVVQWCVRTP